MLDLGACLTIKAQRVTSSSTWEELLIDIRQTSTGFSGVI